MEQYRVLEQIGEGSFGKVFKGMRRETNEYVALKIIPTRTRSDKEIRTLKQECDIQKNLKHRNIIRMLDSFVTFVPNTTVPNAVVVVTEYAPKDLNHLMEERRRKKEPLRQADVQKIACDLISALFYLHDNRILHRDIKPQNILIGYDGLAKLCDFGFARTMGIDTYVLTSMKGTPLYMAPEIIHEKPYDHNADLWSLGCIIYELYVGEPPFSTSSLVQLVHKIKNENIIWPEVIKGVPLSFLKGLLEKDPQKRLTWPGLLEHPFICNGILVEQLGDRQFSLTKALSPSQEFEKEKQKDTLQKNMAKYSRLLIKTAKKLEEVHKEIQKCSNEEKNSHRSIFPTNIKAGYSFPTSSKRKVPPRIRDVKANDSKLQMKKLELQLEKTKIEPINENEEGDAQSSCSSSSSSCETMTSSSSGSDSDDESGKEILDKILSNHHKKPQNEDKNGGGSDKELLWKSGALFALPSFGVEDKPVETEEWAHFLNVTMKEVCENPKSLCEKHFLNVLVSPLRNHLTTPVVVEKIATLLSLPFTLKTLRDNGDFPLLEDSLLPPRSEPDYDEESELIRSLENIYLDSKVLPNLVYACKLTIRRRRLEKNPTEINDIVSIMTAEDLDSMDKSLRLICFLVHSDEDFVAQFCDSVCVLQSLGIIHLFLKLDKRKSRLTSDSLALLGQIARSSISNGVSILEELFLEENEIESDLWRLLSHGNALIQSRALRLLGYMLIHSEKCRSQLLGKRINKTLHCIRNSLSHAEFFVREAAAFALENVRSSPH